MEPKKLCVIVFSLAGCASYPQPTEKLATSVGTVHGAQEAGAERLPDAALHLRLAEEQNEKATKLMKDGDNERATFMAERARRDGELALALAREDSAKKRAQQASASLTPTPAEGTSGGMQPGTSPSTPATDPTMKSGTSGDPSSTPSTVPGTVPVQPTPSTP